MAAKRMNDKERFLSKGSQVDNIKARKKRIFQQLFMFYRRIIVIFIFSIIFRSDFAMGADLAIVVARFGSCDYFIADGPNGLYVLEWYGGYDPDEGDRIYGEIGSYGCADVFYPDQDAEGQVWVEDYLESESTAFGEISNHC